MDRLADDKTAAAVADFCGDDRDELRSTTWWKRLQYCGYIRSAEGSAVSCSEKMGGQKSGGANR